MATKNKHHICIDFRLGFLVLNVNFAVKFIKNKAMRFLSLSVLLVLVFFGCSKTTKNNDLKAENLKGKIKSIRTIPYDAVEKFGEIKKSDIRHFSYSYGNTLQLLEKFFNPYENTLVTFNLYGNTTESNTYKSNGSLYIKTTFKYDEKENIIEGNQYESDGSLNGKSTFKHDKKGNIIEANLYKSDGSLNNKLTFKHDKKGNIIEVNLYKSDGSLMLRLIINYDEKENMTKISIYEKNGSEFSRNTLKYDEKRNVIELNEYRSDGRLLETNKFKYTKYDKQGNWIEKITHTSRNSKAFKPTEITERTIEYYD